MEPERISIVCFAIACHAAAPRAAHDEPLIAAVRAFHRALYVHRGNRYEYTYSQIRFNEAGAPELR